MCVCARTTPSSLLLPPSCHLLLLQDIMAECAQLSQFDEELYKVTGAWRCVRLAWLYCRMSMYYCTAPSVVSSNAHHLCCSYWTDALNSSTTPSSPTLSLFVLLSHTPTAPHTSLPVLLLPPPPTRGGRGQVPDCHQRADPVCNAPQGLV